VTGGVRGEYARLAERYDARWATYIERSLGMLRPFVTGMRLGRVLDLGCGTANLLPRLARWDAVVERYVGADVSVEMLGVARAKLAASPFPAALVAAEVGALPFAGAAFDTVISASSLHYWPHPEPALAEARRVLAVRGRLILLDWCRDALGMRGLNAWLRISRDPYHRMYSQREAADLLRGAGFRLVGERRASIGFPWTLMVLDAVSE
jgi:ubiquinone/menaquinone biosynthesis C-methylase UbiE